ncbi:hypothetical protein MRX96_017878 [Rhipicephalus microplus]
MPSLIKSWQSCSVTPPILEVRNTELTQELLVNSGCEVKNPGFPWVLRTPGWLPGSIQDVVWRYGWSALPTADRMYKWHYVRSEQCVHCGMFEDNKHALLACRVAKTFWSLAGRAYHPLGVDRFLKRKRCPNGALAHLVLTAVAAKKEKGLWSCGLCELIDDGQTSMVCFNQCLEWLPLAMCWDHQGNCKEAVVLHSVHFKGLWLSSAISLLRIAPIK